ncbi:putative Clip-domain serine protease [Daphnia magna]|uniref:Clip-domain serine protease n=1 Tax=Daphnia magna TaxID=35525 RepID=A0A0P4XMG3_9CRUS|nr:putative Clip-domain serine protease [Daphnia magna]
MACIILSNLLPLVCLFYFSIYSTAAKPDGCGIRANTQTRIVGGEVSYPGKWPWMAALYRSNTNQYCAGALISDRHVLTAAHCVSGVHPSKLHIRLGEFDIPGRLPTSSTQPNKSSSGTLLDENSNGNNLYSVEKIIVHQQYEPRSHLHDIAIVRLGQAVLFSPVIQRICLPPPSLPSLEDRTAIVAGWGTTAFLGTSSPSLREVEVPIWNNQACLQAIGKNVFNTTLCAGGRIKSADACQGDSGGPLMMPMVDDRWAAIGVVSWGIRCGEPTKPGLYTRTSHYTDWILSTVQRTA